MRQRRQHDHQLAQVVQEANDYLSAADTDVGRHRSDVEDAAAKPVATDNPFDNLFVAGSTLSGTDV